MGDSVAGRVDDDEGVGCGEVGFAVVVKLATGLHSLVIGVIALTRQK